MPHPNNDRSDVARVSAVNIPDQHSNTKPEAYAPFASEGAPGYHTFLPHPPAVIGSPLPADRHPQNATLPPLFKPLKIRSVEWPHRMWVAPMCQCTSPPLLPSPLLL